MGKVGLVRLPEGDTHFRAAAEAGEYQRGNYLAALAHVRERSCAVDVGAHVGFWTLEMAASFGRVYAIEPIPENFSCLVENTRHLTNVEAINRAAGREVMECAARNPAPENSGAWECLPGSGIPVFPLDELDLQSVGLVKIDVQGMEPDVLEGARETLSRCRPVVVVECIHRGKFDHGPGEFMASLGATGKRDAGKDMIYWWPE